MATQPNYYNDGDWTNGFYAGFDPFYFPFLNNPTPDPYCRITDAMLSINPVNYSPAALLARSYTNRIIHTDDMTSIAWLKSISGTGVLPVVTGGFTGPDGGLSAWRLQMDRGSGSTPIISGATLNGNFEVTTAPFPGVPWQFSQTGGTATGDTVLFHSSTRSFKFTLAAGTNKKAQVWQDVLVVGHAYSFSYYAITSAGAPTIRFFENGNAVGTLVTPAGTWAQYSGTFTATGITFTGELTCLATGDTINLDDVELTDVTPATSLLYQSFTSLANPHSSASGVWAKSNTGVSQIVGIYDDVNSIYVAQTITPAWQRFTTLGNRGDTSSTWVVGSVGSIGGTQAADILVALPQFDTAAVIGPFIPTTTVARTITTPYYNANADPLGYLVEEAPMQLTDLQKANIRQTYARVPADQIYPASRVVVRPVMNDIYTGNYFAVSFDNGITSTVFSSRIGTLPNSASLGTDIPPTVPVNVITSVPAKSFQSLPGDTITIVDSGAASYAFTLTTAASAIQSGMATALTALTGVSARGIGNSLTLTWATGTVKSVSGTSAAKISGTSTSIVFEMPDAGANVTQNTAWTYIPNVMQSLRQVNANSHGGNVGDQTVVWNGPKIICISRVVLATTNTYAIPLSDLPGNDIVATHCQFAKNGTRYVNGPKECVVKRTDAYFLPGVTSGINTFADIPRYTPETDPIKWLAAIANANTYAVESVSDLTQWKGQILVQERNEVLMADALTTTTPGA